MADDTKTIAFVVYPGFTLLDLVGPLQVLGAMAAYGNRYEVRTVGEHTERQDTDTPLAVTPSHTFADVPHPHIVVVPGGMEGTFRAMADETLLGYLRTAATTAELMTSVCTGSLVLGAAGLLAGRQATTHWAALDKLTAFGATPVRRRWVEDGPVLTAAGVSAGIDMALHLIARLEGEQTARGVQYLVEYDPEPPQGELDWSQAPRALFEPVVDEAIRTALADHPELAGRLT